MPTSRSDLDETEIRAAYLAIIDFLDSRGVDSDRMMNTLQNCDQGTVKTMCSLINGLNEGDEACVAILQLAWNLQEIGFKNDKTTWQDVIITNLIAEQINGSHPDAGFVLQSMSSAHLITSNYQYVNIPMGSADFLEILDKRECPGDFEMQAIFRLTQGLGHCLEATTNDRDKISLLMAGERILGEMESKGLDCADLRKDFAVIAQDHMDYGKQAFEAYRKFITKGSIHSRDPHLKPADYDEDAHQRVNPLFRLILDHAATRNHIGRTFSSVLGTFAEMLVRIQVDSKEGGHAWLYDPQAGLLSSNPKNVIDLMLKTFSVPTRSLSFSFGGVPGVESVDGPGIDRFNFSKEDGSLGETRDLKLINVFLNTHPHDVEQRKTAYTNLLTAVVSLTVLQRRIERYQDGYDEMLMEIIPYADVAKSAEKMTERESEILGGVIVRSKPELIDIVPLTARGKIFANDLGM